MAAGIHRYMAVLDIGGTGTYIFESVIEISCLIPKYIST